MAEGIFQAGTYEVSHGEDKTTVEVDRFEYRGEFGNELHAIKGDETVAVFKWWDAVTLKD